MPAVVRWPGRVPAGAVSRAVVHAADLFPTLLGVAGGKAEGVDGADVLDVWAGKAAAPDRTLFWEWRVEGSNQLAAMRGSKKLVVTGNGRPELFDVEADPAERRNVAAEHPDLVKSLQADLKKWLATETGR